MFLPCSCVDQTSGRYLKTDGDTTQGPGEKLPSCVRLMMAGTVGTWDIWMVSATDWVKIPGWGTCVGWSACCVHLLTKIVLTIVKSCSDSSWIQYWSCVSLLKMFCNKYHNSFNVLYLFIRTKVPSGVLCYGACRQSVHLSVQQSLVRLLTSTR